MANVKLFIFPENRDGTHTYMIYFWSGSVVVEQRLEEKSVDADTTWSCLGRTASNCKQDAHPSSEASDGFAQVGLFVFMKKISQRLGETSPRVG